MTQATRIWICAAVLTIAGVAAAGAQDNRADARWLAHALQLEDTSVIADIGAGGGELSLELSAIVPRGKIYSTELGEESLRELREAVDSVGHIEVRPAHPDHANLPEECCDAIFMRNVYHHFVNPDSMNSSIWESLKPGGRVAVIDFAPRGGESSDPAGRATGRQHGITADTVISEMKRAGFTLIDTEQREDRSIYVVMRKE